MFLRTRIILIFLGAFLIIAVTMLMQNYVSREEIKRVVVSELALGQNVIWDKILSSSQEKMMFYAYDARPGMPSIWALRGSRSAIAAVESKNKKQIERAISKFFQGVVKEEIMDHLIIFDENLDPIHALSQNDIVLQKLNNYLSNIKPGSMLNPTKGVTHINEKLCSVVIFPIFSNGRPIGHVLYAKKLHPLIKVFAQDAQADFYSKSDQDLLFTETQIKFDTFKTFKIDENQITIKIGSKTFSINQTKINLLDQTKLPVIFYRNITSALEEYNKIFIISGMLIGCSLIIIGIIIYFMLRIGFKPLYAAIETLNAIVAGNTDVKIDVKREDEVGQIAKAIQSFREAVINYSNLRSTALKNRTSQEGKIVEETLKLAKLLPKEIRGDLLADAATMQRLIKEKPKSEKGLFDNEESQSMKLLSVAFSRVSKEIKTLFQKQVKLTQAYQRFVPEQLLDNLGKKNITQVSLGDQKRKEMTVLFSDIRSFTTITETLSPKESFKFVNDYLSAVVPSIRNHNGYVDKYVGDAIMALYDHKSLDAVLSAINMLGQLEKFNKIRESNDSNPIKIGIGINCGQVMFGTLGVPNRFDGSAIGDTVNVAARLEELTKFYKVPLLVSSSVAEKISSSSIRFRQIDTVEVKGKKIKEKVFEVFEWENSFMIRNKEKMQEIFSEALLSYENQYFSKAKKLFLKCKNIFSTDPVVNLYLKRISEKI